jgi:hypothetical protein
MTINKTPGVYVIEKSIFPPSVAQVATAIPAFIGYTEKAMKRVPDDLNLKPTKIESLLEYRQYFGGAPPLNINKVELNSNNALADATIDPQYFLYDSLQLFFLNGGGECYIISVGKYGQDIILGDRSDPNNTPGLDVGLAMLEKEDEPTIILFPDAVKITPNTDLYELQKAALRQCNDLGDRVAVFDLREEYDSNGNIEWETFKNEFRDLIGTSFLKYGAAYSPHLQTNFTKNIKYQDIRNNSSNPNRLTRSGVPISLENLTTDQTIKSAIASLNLAVDDVEVIAGDLDLSTTLEEAPYNVNSNSSGNLRLAFDSLYNEVLSDNTAENYGNLLNFLYEIVVVADGWFFRTVVGSTSSSINPDEDTYQKQARNILFTTFDNLVSDIIAFDKGATSEMTDPFNRFLTFAEGGVVNSIVANSNYQASWAVAADPPSANTAPFTGANNAENRTLTLLIIRNLFERLMESVEDLINLADERMNILEEGLLGIFPTYKNLLEKLNEVLCSIPPSGAIAGVYAQVDLNRGVWKAPANVSLNGVADLTVKFSESDTDDLNVDTNFGKSINALKFMTGMGFMVWGARTLAGNDNEWRYISVRRFFNMVEESVKKSTMWAVFEPNDAGTWVKVKSMIKNFLLLQWRNGALQGAKPDDSFSVAVGLGETMTPLDILEGRMIVEISMAVVRPAEFIQLVFSHQMVQS